jgi:cytochrome b involved in lipid metabolism
LKKYQIKKEFIDATKIFKDFGHSSNAYSMLKKFQIGKLKVKNFHIIIIHLYKNIY